MRRSLRGLGEALRLPEDFWRFGPPTIRQRLTAQIMIPAVPGRDRSLAATLDVLPTLPTITLQSELLSRSGEEPLQTSVRVSEQPGPIVSTRVHAFQGGREFMPSDDYHGQGGVLRGLPQLGPGAWHLVVRREGVDPRGAVRVEQAYDVVVRARPAPPPPPPPRPTPPTISAAAVQTGQGTMIKVTGTGFLPNLRADGHGISIRLVDGVRFQDYGFYPAASTATGALDATVGPVLVGNLGRNALGQAQVAVSATDPRTDPGSTPANQPLWSNTVVLPF